MVMINMCSCARDFITYHCEHLKRNPKAGKTRQKEMSFEQCHLHYQTHDPRLAKVLEACGELKEIRVSLAHVYDRAAISMKEELIKSIYAIWKQCKVEIKRINNFINHAYEATPEPEYLDEGSPKPYAVNAIVKREPTDISYHASSTRSRARDTTLRKEKRKKSTIGKSESKRSRRSYSRKDGHRSTSRRNKSSYSSRFFQDEAVPRYTRHQDDKDDGHRSRRREGRHSDSNRYTRRRKREPSKRSRHS